jgi:hypothetical protein
MKVHYLALVVAIGLFSGVSHADSIDSFVLTGPVYTWSWILPASPGPNMTSPPEAWGLFGISILTEGPAGPGIGIAVSHDLFFENNGQEILLSCNSECNGGAVFFSDRSVWSGTFASFTFLPGAYTDTRGGETLSITNVPEGSEIAMFGITALAMLGAMIGAIKTDWIIG